MPSGPAPPGPVAVVGLGLIGGSVALGLRRAGIDVVTWSRSESTRQLARDGGVEVVDRLADAVAGAAMVVLACDLEVTGEILAGVNQALGGRSDPPTVTDVGSVKAPVLAEAAEVLDDPAIFVGGHPLAGTEARGFGAAAAGMFADRTWAVTTDPPAVEERIDAVVRLADALGARPQRITAADHDRTLGLTSHTVHVIAAELCRLAGRDHRATGLAGRSFADATRVARGGGADLGRVMAAANAEAVADHLDDVIGDLTEVREGLATGDTGPLDRLFADASKLAGIGLAAERPESTEP